MQDDDVDHRAGEARYTVPSDVAELVSLRRSIGGFLEAAGAQRDVVSDFQLAASELATNVIQHSSSQFVSVLIRRSESEWVMEIGGADGLDRFRVTDPSPAPVEEPSGRGLMIVNLVMDSVDLVEEDGQRIIRCVKRIE
jgi:serine/threonine-protein kinase RsbW